MAELATIKFLEQPTSDAWLQQALAHLPTLLLDHSHCERKAAGVALNLIFRYPSSHLLVRKLTSIAQEELQHFEQVNQWLERLQIPLAPLPAAPYASRLKASIRPQEPHRMLDALLISALIEARSHERLGLLATHLPHPELAQFYRTLMASEARHYGIYWILATTYFDTDEAQSRWQALAHLESEILSSLHPEPRIHS